MTTIGSEMDGVMYPAHALSVFFLSRRAAAHCCGHAERLNAVIGIGPKRANGI